MHAIGGRRNHSGGVLHGGFTVPNRHTAVSVGIPASPPVSSCSSFARPSCPLSYPYVSPLVPRMRNTAVTRRYGAVFLAIRSLTASSSAPAAPSRTSSRSSKNSASFPLCARSSWLKGLPTSSR